jgi:hypothetical protein
MSNSEDGEDINKKMGLQRGFKKMCRGNKREQLTTIAKFDLVMAEHLCRIQT